jgi:hypothetical protein
MPKTKKQNKKESKPATNRKVMIFKSLTAFFATTTICLAGFAIFLYFNQKSPLENRKIQAFESFVVEAITSANKLTGEEKRETRAVNIGIDDNNNLYIDAATLEVDDDKIPSTITKSRLVFKCDKFDGRVIGINTESTCKTESLQNAPEYIETSVRDHFKEIYEKTISVYDEFIKEIKATYGEGRYIENEDGTWDTNIEDLSEEEIDELQSRLAEVREKYSSKFDEIEEYDDLYEKVWQDYLNK